METPRILAVRERETPKTHVELHDGLYDRYEEEIELARLVDKVEKLLILAGEIHREIAGIEVHARLVQDDIKLHVFLVNRIEARDLKKRRELVKIPECIERPRVWRIHTEKIGIASHMRSHPVKTGRIQKIAQTPNIDKNLLLLEPVNFLDIGEKIYVLVVIVDIPENIHEIGTTRNLEMRISSIVVRDIHLYARVVPFEKRRDVLGFSASESTEDYPKSEHTYFLKREYAKIPTAKKNSPST